ncbi:hypothetical protein SAMN05421766_102141 [Zobellia uliginosa]|uniref:CarboxypepD_reg-like domain-containing protein n=1 Tax=Zobellia uliginosa TaxID=143224 RepID=A0ABY1KLI1_9FLAO|nr:hypothetical protein [Zobellia uliginosa]SIS47534.1 hypothetical protein SAMN05421766_102141 [Zobellia uliginosa]
MRKIFYLCVLIMFACSSKKVTYYQGYVYDVNHKPLENLVIEGRDYSETKSLTNSQGYFKMKTRQNWFETFLYVKDKEIKIDSIQVLRTHPEFVQSHHFVNGKNDTLFLRVKKQ